MEIDYEEAYQEDKNIRTAIGIELNSTLTAANQMVAEGYTDVHFSGDMRDFSGQPTTENWQKAIGATITGVTRICGSKATRST